MKKLFVTLVLAIGSMGVVMPTYATPVAQVCDSNSPCLYTGEATSPGDPNNPLKVIVKYGKDGKIVASVVDNYSRKLVGTYYVLTSTSANDKQHGTHYFNYSGKKYYFTM